MLLLVGGSTSYLVYKERLDVSVGSGAVYLELSEASSSRFRVFEIGVHGFDYKIGSYECGH